MCWKKLLVFSVLISQFLFISVFAAPSVFEFFNRAYLHYERSEYKEAAKLFEELSDKYPGTEWSIAAEYYFALCLEDLQQAIIRLDRLIQNHTDSPYAAGARLTIGKYTYYLGDYETSREYLQEYIEISANLEKKKDAQRIILRSFLAEEKYLEFRKYLDIHLKDYPEGADDFEIQWYHFMTTFMEKEYNGTVSLGEQIVRDYPENFYLDRMYFVIMMAYQELQDNVRAQYYKNLLEDKFPRSRFLEK